MLQAKYGDSFLISLKKQEDGNAINLLIDCGFNDTFENSLKLELKKLTDKKEKISRLIITHLDQDHIQGAISFLEQNGKASETKIVEVEEIWHNAYRHFFTEQKIPKLLSTIERYRLKSFYRGLMTRLKAGNVESDISAKESSTLGSLIMFNNYIWNNDTNGNGIYVKVPTKNSNKTYKELNTIKITKDVSLVLLSPSFEKLAKTRNKFETELKKAGVPFNVNDEFIDISFELSQLLSEKEEPLQEENISSSIISSISIEDVLTKFKIKAFKEDKSFGNGSSIAFVLDFDNKRILYLSDAHPTLIKYSLENLYPKESYNYPLIFDAIKISHHGSSKNTSPELLETIDSDIYLISTDGSHPRHAHPDIETLAWIIRRSIPKSINKRKLIFNYETRSSTLFNQTELKEYFNFEVLIQQNISL